MCTSMQDAVVDGQFLRTYKMLATIFRKNPKMTIMEEIFNFLSLHWLEIVGLLLAYFGIILPILQYLSQRKQEERDKRFNNFHRLVREMVEPDPVTGNIMLDRQIAVTFEFRNYPEYFAITKRLLSDLRNQWNAFPRLIIETDLTLQYIEYKRTFVLFRIFKKKP